VAESIHDEKVGTKMVEKQSRRRNVRTS